MTIEECRAFGESLSNNLLLRYSPIAMKLLYDESEIPEGSLRPLKDRGEHLAMCQTYATVRRDRVSLTMLKEDHWCVWPLVSYGLVTLDEDDRRDNAIAYILDQLFMDGIDGANKYLKKRGMEPLAI